MRELSIRKPDDWHLHVRDGEMLKGVVPCSSAHFGRAIIMPNLVPPVVTTKDAAAYRERIVDAIPAGDTFEPMMTLYLTETTDPDDVEAGFRSGLVHALKLYPAGATTNSESGVRNIDNVMPVLERMASLGLPLCIHGEVTSADVDIFDREAVFIETVLDPLRKRLPELKIVMEHITTSEGAAYALEGGDNLAATITPHHLMINRNTILVGGIKPHFYCLPIAKRESHRLALRKAATSGDKHFFLGTDSAPHVDPRKECSCGCAGVFCAPNTIACVAHVFAEENALDKLESFTSLNGPAFYGKAPNEERITLVESDEPQKFPAKVMTNEGAVTVFDPMVPIHWNVQ